LKFKNILNVEGGKLEHFWNLFNRIIVSIRRAETKKSGCTCPLAWGQFTSYVAAIIQLSSVTLSQVK
jgi:hypothetical protein